MLEKIKKIFDGISDKYDRWIEIGKILEQEGSIKDEQEIKETMDLLLEKSKDDLDYVQHLVFFIQRNLSSLSEDVIDYVSKNYHDYFFGKFSDLNKIFQK